MSKLSDSIGQFATIPFTVVKLIPTIGADAFTLWSYLRYRTNGESGIAFPSYETIQKDTGFNPRKIALCLRTLEANGLMTRHKRFGNSTEYTLVCPEPQSLPIGSKVLTMVEEESLQRGKTNKIDSTKTDSTKIDNGAANSAALPAQGKPNTAVGIFKSVRRFYPAKETWTIIENVVGVEPRNLDLWRQILIAYALCGWNPRNVDQPLDYFRRGEVPRTKRIAAAGQTIPTDRNTRGNVREALAMFREQGIPLASDNGEDTG